MAYMKVLYHYTDRSGYDGINDTKTIRKTFGKDGVGVYFTSRCVDNRSVTKEDIASDNYNNGGSKNLRNGKIDYIVEVHLPSDKVKETVKRRNVWLYPSNEDLDLANYKHALYPVSDPMPGKTYTYPREIVREVARQADPVDDNTSESENENEIGNVVEQEDNNNKAQEIALEDKNVEGNGKSVETEFDPADKKESEIEKEKEDKNETEIEKEIENINETEIEKEKEETNETETEIDHVDNNESEIEKEKEDKNETEIEKEKEDKNETEIEKEKGQNETGYDANGNENKVPNEAGNTNAVEIGNDDEVGNEKDAGSAEIPNTRKRRLSEINNKLDTAHATEESKLDTEQAKEDGDGSDGSVPSLHQSKRQKMSNDAQDV